MHRLAIVAVVFAVAGSAYAGPCRDPATGRAKKCAAPMIVSHCRDKTTKQPVACSAPNAEPAPWTKRINPVA